MKYVFLGLLEFEKTPQKVHACLLSQDLMQACRFKELIITSDLLSKSISFLEMLLFLNTAQYLSYIFNLSYTLWVGLIDAFDFVVRWTDPIDIHYIVQ